MTIPKPKVERFFITATEAVTVKQLLTAHLPDRYHPETVITHGGVWKDRKRIMDPSFKLRPRETLKVHTSPFQGKYYTLDPRHIIFENEDLLVVYKPRDLNVHGVPSSIYYTLTYGVNRYLEQQGIDFEANPVTRLDRPVEGLVIFPKNKSSERTLFKRVKQRQVKKWYMAALEKPEEPTAPPPKYLRIRDRIHNDGKRTCLDKNGKDADSLFVKTAGLEKADIYSIFIFTGRRHQIRFHAAHYLAPVIGDRLYGSHISLPPDEIALVCRGYNIPYRGQNLRIRLPGYLLDRFHKKLKEND
jgi:23S rRNA-/tRNA-specific pseudouridylate synthase